MIVRDRSPLRSSGQADRTSFRGHRRAGVTVTFLTTTLLVVGLAAAAALAAAGPQPGARQSAPEEQRGPGLVPPGIGSTPYFASPPLLRFMAFQAGQLKLTDEQYSALRSTYQTLQSELRPLLTKLQEARTELMKLWKESPVDEEAVLQATEKVTKLSLEIRSKVAAAQEKVEDLLTPQQKKELEALRRQWQEKQQAQNRESLREKAQDREAWQDRERTRKLMELRDRIRNQQDARFPYLEPGRAAFLHLFPLFPGLPFGR